MWVCGYHDDAQRVLPFMERKLLGFVQAAVSRYFQLPLGRCVLNPTLAPRRDSRCDLGPGGHSGPRCLGALTALGEGGGLAGLGSIEWPCGCYPAPVSALGTRDVPQDEEQRPAICGGHAEQAPEVPSRAS